jgi:hypothetical protein
MADITDLAAHRPDIEGESHLDNMAARLGFFEETVRIMGEAARSATADLEQGRNLMVARTLKRIADYSDAVRAKIRASDAMIAAGGVVGLPEDVREMVAERNSLRDALIKLSNEVVGTCSIAEPMLRHEVGNTNYTVLMQRANEARALLGEQT